MGTAPDQFDILAHLYERGLIPHGAAIADIGCQQLWGATGEDVARFARAVGKTLSELQAHALALNGVFIGEIFKAVGWRYRSFDIVEAPHCEFFDLNTYAVRARHRGAFDLVFNFGTTEHVMNQYNAFKALHDFAKPGGLIYSYFIRAADMDHGLVHYSDRFIGLWMRSNSYEEVWRSDAGAGACTWIVVRKTSDEAFRPVIDVQEGEGLPVIAERQKTLWRRLFG